MGLGEVPQDSRQSTMNDADMDYFRGRCNVSAMTDRELFDLQRSAERRFFADPGRTLRIAARHPRRTMLAWYAFQNLIKAIPHARGFKCPALLRRTSPDGGPRRSLSR